jgi:hypothetical protein
MGAAPSQQGTVPILALRGLSKSFGGTRALHGLRALVSESVAARLLRAATVPVIVVPQDVREVNRAGEVT